MFPATGHLEEDPVEWGGVFAAGMQSLLAWLPPVACCVAIQGFWLAMLVVINPGKQPQNLQDLHPLPSIDEPTVRARQLNSRV